MFSVLSLVPGLLSHLTDAGTNRLPLDEQQVQSTSAIRPVNERFGLPLHIFGQGCYLQPYIALQQIAVLQAATTKSYVVGTTNIIFAHHKACQIDVFVNVEKGEVDFYNEELEKLVALTPADRRFMDQLMHIVNNTWHEKNNGESSDTIDTDHLAWEGSEDWLREEFSNYLQRFLAAAQADDDVPTPQTRGKQSVNLYFLITF